MGRNIRAKNKNTGEWEIIASGNSSGISTTNPNFLEGEENAISVDKAMDRLNEKIKKLERNVSWLALYGGSGSGGSGGGGGYGEAKFSVTNSTVNQGVNTIYTSKESVTLNYLISSIRNNQKYYITVSLDGNTIITNQVGYSGVAGNIIIPEVAKYSDLATHNVTITVTDSEGINLEAYLLTVIESSIKLSSKVSGVTATIGLGYTITYFITNKVVNKETSLTVTNITNGVSKTYDLGVFTTTEEHSINISFFDDLFPLGATPATGSSYTIEAIAQTSMEDGVVQSNKVTNRVIIEDGANLVVLVDGITTKEEVESGAEPTIYAQDGNISFSFTPYLAGVNIVYYALRLTNGPITHDVGYFEPTAENPLTSNSYAQKGTGQVFSWAIPQESDYIGKWDITLRCWSEKGSPVLDTHLVCTVSAASQALLEEQNPNNRRFASWDIKSASFPQNITSTTWVSTERDYKAPGESTAVENTTTMNIYDTNGLSSGFLTQNGQNKLRLAGESYAIIDCTPFKTAPGGVGGNWGDIGFSFSITFKTDKHPFSDRTVFFIGDYSSTDENELIQGIKVGLEEIIWKYKDGSLTKTLSCRIQQNVINCVDFVLQKTEGETYFNVETGKYEDTESWIAKIFINGVLNAAAELTNTLNWQSNSNIYLACDVNPDGGKRNFADVEIYNVKLFRGPLNDKEIVINSMNSRAKANLDENGVVKFTEYNTWKNRNFFPPTTGVPSVDATSTLWDNTEGTYKSLDFRTLISDTNRRPPIPVMLIECTETSNFTRATYEQLGANTTWYKGNNVYYYDPNSTKSSIVQTTDVSVQIQGTSSTGYRSKNLEIRFDKVVENSEVELFQPKDTWMPENQFTLKADVVDSAHANNASIGKWINDNADALFDKTPPMTELEAHRPVDTYEPSKVHEKVTIKHTLEGFPIILLVRFSGESTDTMLGIYSFNLGRNSFYNMGFKFFKSFTTSTKGVDGQITEQALPAFVTNYETYEIDEPFGSIDQRQVYSYEISEDANTVGTGKDMQPLALFWQDDLTIIKHVGEFRYNGANGTATNVTDEGVWERLQLLFSALSGMTSSDVDKYYWDTTNNTYKKKPNEYYPAVGSADWSSRADLLNLRLNIRNAYSYFIICTAFGLVDSLGKNFTLRSWNVGGSTTDENMNKWWPCFYDMDTATGLSNTGEENVKKTAYIDVYKNAVVEEGVNSLQISYNSADGGFDTYSSRLWDVLRNNIFIATGIYQGNTYNSLWATIRKGETLISSSNHFVNEYFTSQTRECGELLYNYDYKVKYLTKYKTKSGDSYSSKPSYANLNFLHGTRTEYVRDWLKKRFYFFDGVFLYSDAEVLFPYNTIGTFSCGGPEDSSNPVLNIKCNTPIIFTVNIGQTSEGDIRYFIDENTPTKIVLKPITNFNKQVTINAVNEISVIDGLKNIRFQRFMSSMSLPSLAEVDLLNVKTIENEPIDFGKVFVGSDSPYSEIRHINLANINFWSGSSVQNPAFTVDLTEYDKLKTLNIANSCVTSMKLPSKSSLTELSITNSNITQINLENQPFLDSIDFTGCNKLGEVIINNCSKIETLELKGLADLKSVVITGCPNLKSVICTGNKNLINFRVEGDCSKLQTIDLSNNTNSGLSIYLVGALNINSLNVSGTTTSQTIEMPLITKMSTLNLSNSSIMAIQFGNNEVPTYTGGEYILDLSNIKITSLSMKNMIAVKYIKFDNNPASPITVTSEYFSNCSSLKRIFGHLRLTGTLTFFNCRSFCINELPTDKPTPIPEDGKWFGSNTSTEDGKREWNSGTNLGTNITIATTDMTSQFEQSGCNLYDVYYILSKCNNVTSLERTFYDCNNVKTSSDGNSFRRNMFAKCGKVTTISQLFYGCGSVDSIYYSPTHDASGNITKYDGLLSPLVSLTSMNSAFQSGGIKYLDDLFFAGTSETTTLKITSLSSIFDTYSYNPTNPDGTVKFISNTSPVGAQKETVSESDYSYARASRLFASLPKLTSIYFMFNGNGVQINFDTVTTEGETTYCPLFYNNPNLTSISNSFKEITGKGSLINLFGGDDEFVGVTDKFPQRLSTVLNSFIIALGNGVAWPIKNNMFRKIKSSLKYITGQSTSNSTYTYLTSSFGGPKLTKSFIGDGTGSFPYDVFTECTGLIEAPAFFSKLAFPSNLGVTAELPGNMFINNTKLTNVSNMFAEMSGIKYTLTGYGFKNCKIVNASGIFAETSGSYCKRGSIPYGLFYQEKNETRAVAGWLADNALGIDENFGINEDGTWNDSAVLPTPQSNPFTRTIPNRTIQNLSSCLTYFQSTEANPYTKNIGTGKPTTTNYGDLIIPNEKYNPVKYIKNPAYSPHETIENPNYDPTDPFSQQYIKNPAQDIRRVIINPDYDGYTMAWNKWVVDGTPGLTTTISGSELYTSWAGENPLVSKLPTTFPDEFDIEDDGKIFNASAYEESPFVMEGDEVDYRSVSNYFCPPDIFRCCYNNSSTQVNNAFYGSGYIYTSGRTEYYKYGVRGRIPPHIFEPVNKLTSLKGIFYYCTMINPYTWPQESTETGKMYPEKLLSTCTVLQDISQLFAVTEVPLKVTVPATLFSNNVGLRSVNRLWMGTKWYGGSQLPSTIFLNCNSINDVTGMLASWLINEDGTTIPGSSINESGRPPKQLDGALLFTNTLHKSIARCSAFLYNGTATRGTLPTFWTWMSSVPATSRANVFYGVRKASVSNEDSAPSDWLEGMV